MNELNITNIEYLKNSMTKDIACNIDSPSICVLKNANAINISGWAYCDNKKINENIIRIICFIIQLLFF